MKKWIDDIEKQIDAIEAGEVDAKNLSEVLDKDAPIKLTTDLQNNKVKVGLDIDSETLEVNNGKLKVKAGGSGAKKYLHTITVSNLSGTSGISKIYTVQLILDTSEPITNGRTFVRALLTLPTTRIHFGNGAFYNGITPIINSAHTMSSDFKQIKRAIWVISLGDYVGIAYTYTNLTDGDIGYYFTNGYTIDGNSPSPSNSSVWDIVTEL